MFKLGIFCSWKRKKKPTREGTEKQVEQMEKLLDEIIKRKIKPIVEKSVAETIKKLELDNVVKPRCENNPFTI